MPWNTGLRELATACEIVGNAGTERTTMNGQTDKKMKKSAAQRLQGPKGLTEGARLVVYAAADHQRLSGASMPLVAQYRASR